MLISQSFFCYLNLSHLVSSSNRRWMAKPVSENHHHWDCFCSSQEALSGKKLLITGFAHLIVLEYLTMGKSDLEAMRTVWLWWELPRIVSQASWQLKDEDTKIESCFRATLMGIYHIFRINPRQKLQLRFRDRRLTFKTTSRLFLKSLDEWKREIESMRFFNNLTRGFELIRFVSAVHCCID